MNANWQIYALIFTAVFLAAEGFRGLYLERRAKRRLSARLAPIERGFRQGQDVDLLRRRTSSIRLGEQFSGVRLWFIQTGSNLTGVHLLAIWGALALILFVLLRRFGAVPGLLLSLALAAGLLYLYLARMRSQRIARFGEQFPDVLDVIVRSLRAGHPVAVSLALVAAEMPEPTGPEFALVSEEIAYGRELREALDNLERRVGHPELRFFITSVAIAYQTGGNLGEILSHLSTLLRGRFKLRRKIRALSAEGRFGSYILSAVPPFIFGTVNLLQPSYYREFWGTSAQDTMFTIAGILLVIGNIVIYKMVNFRI